MSLVFMFVLTFAVYLAGLYVFNVERMFGYSLSRMEHVAILMPQQTDSDYAEFRCAASMLEETDGVTLLCTGTGNSSYTTSIMSFNNGFPQYTFQSAEDLRTLCDFLGIRFEETDGPLTDGSMIMSRLQADNRGLKPGDILTGEEEADNLDQEYVLCALTDEEGYSAYYISDSESGSYLILPTGLTDGEFYALLDDLIQNYDVRVTDYQYYKDIIDSQLSSFRYIYFLLILLLAVVMAVTINAAFVGMYQHRRGEFALYRAIGYARKKTAAKIAAEVLLLDAVGIAAGTCLMLLGIYLANELYLLPHGWRLFYYDRTAAVGLLVSNLIIVIPVTMSQGKRLMKADICDY